MTLTLKSILDSAALAITLQESAYAVPKSLPCSSACSSLRQQKAHQCLTVCSTSNEDIRNRERTAKGLAMLLRMKCLLQHAQEPWRCLGRRLHAHSTSLNVSVLVRVSRAFTLVIHPPVLHICKQI